MHALTISKQIIYECNKNKIEITQLKLQKLLYFTEAYYMNMENKDELFEEKFYAWEYGPVCKEVYNEYKNYFSLPIIVDEQNLEKIDEKVLFAVKAVCEVFGKRNTSDLIKLTHLQNSPWFEANHNKKVPISKLETKKWFKELFLAK